MSLARSLTLTHRCSEAGTGPIVSTTCAHTSLSFGRLARAARVSVPFFTSCRVQTRWAATPRISGTVVGRTARQLAGVLHKQNGVGLRRLLTRGLPMRLTEGRIGDVWLIQQTVRRLYLAPGAGLFGQAGLGSRSERSPEWHGAASAARIAQRGRTPLLFRPACRIRKGTEHHVSRLRHPYKCG